MDWMISANGSIYDHASAFAKWGYIDWRQGNRKYNIGDTVYIYCTRPLKRVMYKTEVIKTHLTKDQIQNDYEFWYHKDEYTNSLDGYFARLKLIEQVNRNELSLEILKENGLTSAPQGPIKVPSNLKIYIDQYMNDTYFQNIFPESADTDSCIEGAKITVEVNKYERSSVARQKCIDYHGYSCQVCGINFKDIYGEIGKNFIHVHHIVPLNEIDEAYIVNPSTDLIPVCPNCHAMLHRKLNGKYMSVAELKARLAK